MTKIDNSFATKSKPGLSGGGKPLCFRILAFALLGDVPLEVE
jgi:hypothetical protein